MNTDILYQSLLFLLVIVCLLYLPGTLLQSCLGWTAKDGLSETVLRFAIGLVTVPVLYLMMRRANATDSLMFSVFLVISVSGIYRFIHCRQSIWRKDDWLALFLALMVSSLLLSFSHFADFGNFGAGTWYKTTGLTESTFHLGLINSIKDSFPPPALYAAGSRDFSSYHLNMHLQIEGINRLTGIGTDRLAFWYFPMLYFLLLFLLPVAFVRRLGGAIVPAVVAGMLIFGTGFSFLPGMFSSVDPLFVWVLFFHADNYSLFTLNGLIPALIALFVVLLIFPVDGQTQTPWFWWVMILIMLGAYGFKSSMGTQLAASFILVGIFRYFRKRPGEWRMLIFGLSALFIMLLDQALGRQGMGDNYVEMQPWNSLNSMLDHFGLADANFVQKTTLFLLFLLLGLGVRVLGFLNLRDTIEHQPGIGSLVLYIFVFFLSGYAVADIIYLGDSSYQFNHAVWFAVQGLFASWFLLFLLLARLSADNPKHAILLISLLLFSLPSTAQLLWRKVDSGVVYIGPNEQEVVAYLENIKPNSVVLHPFNYNQPSLSANLAGRSTVLSVDKSFVNESQGLQRRAQAVFDFFDERTDILRRQTILEEYSVTHVYNPHELDGNLAATPGLKLVMRNDRFSVWEVAR